MHPGFIFRPNPEAAFSRLRRPLGEATVAIVTTAGVHRRDQVPFDVEDAQGDPSSRPIAGSAAAAELVATHAHYDTSGPNRDIDCVFPLDTLRRLAGAGEIGAVSPLHYGFMGFVLDPERLLPAAAEAARTLAACADAVLLTPG